MPTTNGCWSSKVANEGTAEWLTVGREAKAELTVVGRLYTVDEQGAENGKLAETQSQNVEQQETRTYLAKRLIAKPLAGKWTWSKHSEARTQQQSMTQMPR